MYSRNRCGLPQFSPLLAPYVAQHHWLTLMPLKEHLCATYRGIVDLVSLMSDGYRFLKLMTILHITMLQKFLARFPLRVAVPVGVVFG